MLYARPQQFPPKSQAACHYCAKDATTNIFRIVDKSNLPTDLVKVIWETDRTFLVLYSPTIPTQPKYSEHMYSKSSPRTQSIALDADVTVQGCQSHLKRV